MPNRNPIDLGLAISGAKLEPGERRTTEELAAWCGVSKQAISKMEQVALRKVRTRLLFTLRKDHITRDDIHQCLPS